MQPEKIIFEHPDEEVVLMMLESNIGDTTEGIYIAEIIASQMRNTKDIIPMITEHRGEALASRCLVSLGFFRDYMKHLNVFHGYPSPEFYMKEGRKAFYNAGKIDVSLHLETWTEFLHDSFKAEVKREQGVTLANIHSRIERGYDNSRVWKCEGRLKRGYDLGDAVKSSQQAFPPNTSSN